MRTGIAAVAALGGATIALTGCGVLLPQPQPTVTVTVTAPSDGQPQAQATPSAAATQAKKVYQLNEWQEVSGLRARVVEMRQDVSKYNQKPDRAALFEVCGAGQAGRISSWSNFLAGDADGGTYPGSSSRYDDYPKPGFPFTSTPISADACTKGWVVFDTNEDTKITKVAFQMDDGRSMAWLVA